MKVVLAWLVFLSIFSLNAWADSNLAWELYDSLKTTSYKAEPLQLNNDRLAERTMISPDGVQRPYVIYVPETYRAQSKTPLMMTLHGGVSRAEFIEDRLKYALDSKFLRIAKDMGWIMIFPFGKQGATWWDKVGMENIQSILKEVKSLYHVDDNRVYMGGFSDGASSSFHFGMTMPTAYAGFVALNGHIGVGGIGGHQLYPQNLANRPTRATSTDLDSLYPNRMIEPMMNFSISEGANIDYQQYFGIGHSFEFDKEEIPVIKSFLSSTERNPVPDEFTWKTSDPYLGTYHWLSIDKILEQPYRDGHEDTNFTVESVRFSYGMSVDDKNGTSSVTVTVVNDDSIASKMGILVGDQILKIGPTEIKSVSDFYNSMVPISGGQKFEVRIIRDGTEMILEGQSPDPQYYSLFLREKKSGQVTANFKDNVFSLETSNVGRVSISLNPEMVDFKRPVSVVINGKQVFNKLVDADLSVVIDSWSKNKDRSLIYLNKLSFDVE